MVDRRTVIATSLAGAAALLDGCASGRPQASASGKVKLTILHHTPKDVAAFEKYYQEKHVPIVATVKGLPAPERSMLIPLRPGAPAPYYDMVEFWFDNMEHFRTVMSSPEWGKVAADAKNFNADVTAVASRIV